MESTTFQVGEKVCVTSYSPFRGLKGTIQTVNTIPVVDAQDEPLCFYLVDLEGTHIKDPVWFDYEEVEPISLGESESIRERQSGRQIVGYPLFTPTDPKYSNPN